MARKKEELNEDQPVDVYTYTRRPVGERLVDAAKYINYSDDENLDD